MCQANLETATWVISAVVAMPPSTRRGGLLAWTIAPSQVRQAYFGKIVLFTRTKAGTTSRASRLLADPMERTGAAGADRGLGLDHLLAPRQVLGKRADVAQRWPAGLLQLASAPVAARPSSNRDHRPAWRIARRSVEQPRPGWTAR